MQRRTASLPVAKAAQVVDEPEVNMLSEAVIFSLLKYPLRNEHKLTGVSANVFADAHTRALRIGSDNLPSRQMTGTRREVKLPRFYTALFF